MTHSKATNLFDPFHQAVCEVLDPWNDDDESDKSDKFMRLMSKLADEHVLDLKVKLHELAQEERKNLESRKYDLSEFETLLELESDFIEDMEETTSKGLLVYQFWSPKLAAGQYRTMVLSRKLKAQALGLHAWRDRLAPPQSYTVSTDHDRPVIATDGGGFQKCRDKFLAAR